MSRCAQSATSPTNCDRKAAAAQAPPQRPAEFLRSEWLPLHLLEELGPERQPPETFAGRRPPQSSRRDARSSEGLKSPAPVGPSATTQAPVRVEYSTIASGVLARRPGERVGQDHPAFGVGVGDLDRLAVGAADDVPGTVGGAVRHVLGERQVGAQTDRQVEPAAPPRECRAPRRRPSCPTSFRPSAPPA